jgi:predicted transcriptional regulator
MATTATNITPDMKKIVKACGKTPRTAADIANRAGFDSGKQVGRSLRRLIDAGLIERTADGLYRKA